MEAKKANNFNTIALFIWPLLLILGLLIWRFGFSGESENRAGKKVYQRYCSNCHMDDGSGLRALIPNLKDSKLVKNTPNAITCLVRNGIEPQGATAENPRIRLVMPAHPDLNKSEMLALIQFLQQKWGNESALISLENIETELKNCP